MRPEPATPRCARPCTCVSSDHLESKIAGSQRIQRLLQGNKSDAEIVDEMYLADAVAAAAGTTRSRRPIEYLAKDKDARAQAVQDLSGPS